MSTRKPADAAFYALVALALALVLWMHAHHSTPAPVSHSSGEGVLV